ncbi:MAG: hypothetical protein PXY39_15065 [archaeon]|nr:hypothetical protein [archaeon]
MTVRRIYPKRPEKTGRLRLSFGGTLYRKDGILLKISKRYARKEVFEYFDRHPNLILEVMPHFEGNNPPGEGC